jgi:hypothetical protein
MTLHIYRHSNTHVLPDHTPHRAKSVVATPVDFAVSLAHLFDRRRKARAEKKPNEKRTKKNLDSLVSQIETFFDPGC